MELLAPAGNLETAVAALQAGADAVYLGLGKFNARSRAENFKPYDLARLLEFAHRNNQKVYLTLNTLIKESEVPELLTALGENIFSADCGDVSVTYRADPTLFALDSVPSVSGVNI